MVDEAGDSLEMFDEARPFAGALYSPRQVRMAFFGLGGGDLLVVTPGAPVSEALWSRVEALGKPKFLLAPNHFHNMGISAWKARYPEAKVVAHRTAVPRLGKRLGGIPVEDLPSLEAALPEGMRLFSPPMAKQGETWISLRTNDGVAWFVTDSILNEPSVPGGALGFVMRVFGFRAGLQTNPFFKRMFLTDKAAYKQWVYKELERDKPTLFVPCHGAPIRGADVAEKLRAVTEEA